MQAACAVELLPSAAVISLRQPLNTVVLKAVPLDQYANEIIGGGAASFASMDQLVATVAADGTVSALAIGQTTNQRHHHHCGRDEDGEREGEWELAGDTLVMEAGETACGTLKLTFTAPVTSTQHLNGVWVASNGVTGTFSLARE